MALFAVKAPSYTGLARGGERAGHGTLEVAGGWLTLRLRQNGSLWGGRTAVRISADRVLNVEHVGTDLAFEWDLGTKRRPRVVLKFARPDDAARVASLLPAVTTADYVRAIAEQQDFEAALRTAAPAVRVTPLLIAVNVAVFLLMVVVGRANVLLPDRDTVLAWGGNHWPLTTGGQWWRLLTCTFLHFGVIHLAFNMAALWSVGPMAERLYGRRFFAALYLAGGVAGSLASTWYNGPRSVGAGASGAVLAVYGMLLAYPLVQRASVPPTVFRSLTKGAAVVVANTLFFGLTQRFIDNAAHVGGLAAGLVLGAVAARPLAPGRRARQAKSRAWAAAAVAVAAGAAAVARLPKCDLAAERAFLGERSAIEADGELLAAALDRVADYAVWRRTPPADFPRLLPEQVGPLLDDMDARLARSPLPATSPSRPLREAWARYAGLERAMATALAGAVEAHEGRRDRPRNLATFHQLQAEAKAAKRDIVVAAKAAWSE